MNVVVYCSAAENLPERWQEGARSVGSWIGSHGAQLVYGGVDSGLMRVTAHAAKVSGANVVGVVPARRRRMAWAMNDVLVPASDLNDRKGIMQMLGDVFVVLPGGYGTLDELATTFSYLNFTDQKRPIIIYNPDGVYDALLAQLEHLCVTGLMKASALEILSIAESPRQLTELLDLTTQSLKK